MRVCKDFYVEDMLDLLEQASNNNHLDNECVDSDLASLLYDFYDSLGDEQSEDDICDYIRFEMAIMTEEEIKNDYVTLEENDFNDEYDDMEDFLIQNTSYIGSYDTNGKTYFVFSAF
jgi:hypothetical protein